MKIVDRETFMSLPPGTVYQKFEPHIFGPVCIKDSNVLDIDWYEVDINNPRPEGCHSSDTYFDALDEMVAGKETARLEFASCRDGLFDKDQKFAIWSSEDVLALIITLQKARDGIL